MPKAYGTPGPRLISPDCCTSQSLAACSLEAQLLFDRLIVQADDQGRLQADPSVLKVACFPFAQAMTTRKIRRFLDELATNGMVIRYKSGRVEVIQLSNWWTFQAGMRRAYPSRWAPPEGWTDRVYGLPSRPTGQDQQADDPPAKRENGRDGPEPAGNMPAASPHRAGEVLAQRGQPAGTVPADSPQSAPLTRGVPVPVPNKKEKDVPSARPRERGRVPKIANVPSDNGDEREADIARARAKLADPKTSTSIREAAIARLQQLGAPLEPDDGVDFGEAPA